MKQAFSVLIANIPTLILMFLSYYSVEHGHRLFAVACLVFALIGLHTAKD